MKNIIIYVERGLKRVKKEFLPLQSNWFFCELGRPFESCYRAGHVMPSDRAARLSIIRVDIDIYDALRDFRAHEEAAKFERFLVKEMYVSVFNSPSYKACRFFTRILFCFFFGVNAT